MSNSISPNDVIMVDIDGNAVPCVVLKVERDETAGGPSCVQLQDTGSGRHFWRSWDSLKSSKRFSGNVVTYHAYSHWLKSHRPDIEVRFLRSKKDEREGKAKKKQETSEKLLSLTAGEIERLKAVLRKKGLLDD